MFMYKINVPKSYNPISLKFHDEYIHKNRSRLAAACGAPIVPSLHCDFFVISNLH